jgi:Trypsin-co-occurring domain 2
MPNNDTSPIGLAEFIQQVKQDLLSVAPGKENDAPFLFVESVELELQVTVKRTAKTGAKGSVKINVFGTGGEIAGEVGGDISHDAVHKVKVKLSPLLDKDSLIKIYKIQHPDKIRGTVDNSLSGLFKGDEESNLIDDLGEQ